MYNWNINILPQFYNSFKVKQIHIKKNSMQSQQHNVKQFHRCGILQKVTRLEANSDAACCQDSDQELNTMVLGGLHRKLGLTQELSFLSPQLTVRRSTARPLLPY